MFTTPAPNTPCSPDHKSIVFTLKRNRAMKKTTIIALIAIALGGISAALANPAGAASDACADPSPVVQFSCN